MKAGKRTGRKPMKGKMPSSHVVQMLAKIGAGMLALLVVAAVAPGFAHASDAPTVAALPSITVIKNSQGFTQAIDLRNYSRTSSGTSGQFAYEISQSNASLVDCYLDNSYFISCNAPAADAIGVNEITVTITDSAGLSATGILNVNVLDNNFGPSDEFTLNTYNVSLEPSQGTGVQAKIRNTTNDYRCYSLSVLMNNSIRNRIDVKPGANSFCLAPKQETGFAITATALSGAVPGNYLVGLQLSGPDSSTIRGLSVNVPYQGEQIGIEKTTLYYACRNTGFRQDIGLRITNNTGMVRQVALSADDTVLLPSFDYPSITLQPGESFDVKMRVHTTSGTPAADYRVPVTATATVPGAPTTSFGSAGIVVKREIDFALVDCTDTFFGLSVTPEKRVIRRGEAMNFNVQVISRSDTDQYVNVSSTSDLPVSLYASNVFLPARGVVNITLTASPRDDENFGIHEIKVYAWNSKEEQQKIVAVEVVSQHLISLLVQDNEFDSRTTPIGGQQAFNVTLRNDGAYDEGVSLSILTQDTGIQAKLSDTQVSVKKGESKNVVVFITPGADAKTGRYIATLRASFAGQVQDLDLRFTVTEQEAGALGQIDIATYPKEIDLNANEGKVLQFGITNTGSQPLVNVKIGLTGIDDVAFFPSEQLGNIEPGKTVMVTGRIYGKPVAQKPGAEPMATYFGKLVVDADAGKHASEDITLRFRPIPLPASASPGAGSAMAGLVVLAGNAGAVILILLAGVILGLVLLGGGRNNSNAGS